jgi:multidrug resistance efflux pump
MRTFARYSLTAVIVIAAGAALGYRYLDYLQNPWTRDGQVRANVIQVASRVSGPIVELPIVDNQAVKAGDLLFRIDPRTYEADLDRARAEYDRTLNELEALAQQVAAVEASVDQYDAAITQAESGVRAAKATLDEAEGNLLRNQTLLEKGDIAQARFDRIEADYKNDMSNKEQADAALLSARSALLQAEATLAQARANLGASGEENARLRAAKAALEHAQLNLEFTEVRASVDGLITNLQLRLGSQAVTNAPALALVDSASFWVEAYFRETMVADITPGDQAVITLMSYPDAPIEGTVDSLAWGIAKDDGSTGANLLPNVDPTFEWIRLAQRIPVRIILGKIPQGVALRVGTTASAMVRSGGQKGPLAPVPSVLQ